MLNLPMDGSATAPPGGENDRPGPADRAGPGTASAPLSPEERARGRRLAITSHPAGMTFSLVATQHLPTLALVSLGASETIVGVQNGLGQALQPLQLGSLRAVGHFSKRRILLFGQGVAVVGAIPLVFYSSWIEGRGGLGIALLLASLTTVTAGLTIGNAVWFPLLRGYVEPGRTGRFFGVLRSGWHLALIVYYAASLRWLALNPGAFGTLFGVAWLCGLLRIFFVLGLPERSEKTGRSVRIRRALSMLRHRPDLRSYLAGSTTHAAIRLCIFPFIIVLMRRELGFGDAQVLFSMIGLFGGGLVSLYLWGRIVDKLGPGPVFFWTCAGASVLTLALVGARGSDPASLALIVAVVFGLSVLSSGFGMADTRVLFELAPAEAPARTLVVAQVTVTVLAGLAPVGVGAGLETWLAAADDRLSVYQVFFVAAAGLHWIAYLPLRRFRRGFAPGDVS